MKDAIDRIIGVVDKDGVVIACSDMYKTGELRRRFRTEDFYASECVVSDGYTFLPLISEDKNGAIVFVEGEDDIAGNTARIVAVSLQNIKELYDEKYDKSSFIKNIMLDNILPSDIYLKSKEMQFDTDAHHIVMIIKFSNYTDVVPLEIVQGMFPQQNGDFVVSVGEQDVVLVKRVDPNSEDSEFEVLAEQIAENISSDFYVKVSIGISSVASTLKDLAKAYKEARIALEVGKVFDLEKQIVCYGNLGIGRLIYQLPTTLCDVFLQEVFKKGSLESLDPDTLMTVQAFFKNNLNVSETSRALFVHRNTLVYRLEKIRKITGLDLRKFEHAVTFKVALMVKKYLTNKPMKF